MLSKWVWRVLILHTIFILFVLKSFIVFFFFFFFYLSLTNVQNHQLFFFKPAFLSVLPSPPLPAPHHRLWVRLLQLCVQDTQHVRAAPSDSPHHAHVRVRHLPQVPQDARAAAGAQEVPHRPVWRAQVRKASTDSGS